MMGAPYELWIPFKRNTITPLDPRLQEELYQDWEEIENWGNSLSFASSGTGFDAIIDPDLAADNPVAGQFTTVKAALVSLKGAGWATNRVVRLGMRGRFTTARVTETASIVASDCPTGGVVLIGLGGVVTPGVADIQWNIAGHTIGGTLWTVENIEIIPGALGAGNGFFSDDCNLTTRNVMFQQGTDVYYTVKGTGFGQEQHYRSTIFQNAVISILVWMYDCDIIFNGGAGTSVTFGNATTGSSFIFEGGTIEGNEQTTWIISYHFVAVSTVFGGSRNSSAGGSGTTIVDLQGGTQQQVMITAFTSQRSGSAACCQVKSTASNPRMVNLVGAFSSINLPAPAVAGVAHFVSAQLRALGVSGAATVTVPATVALNSDTPVTIAGANVVGNIAATGAAGATGITVTAASCALSCTVTHTGAAGGTGLNVSGNNNIIDVANAAAFTTAVTNTGAGNITRNT